MSKKNISDLREVLFETLADLKAGKITIEQAKAASDISQTIINTAKVEVDYIKASGEGGKARFLEAPALERDSDQLPPGVVSVRQHRIAG